MINQGKAAGQLVVGGTIKAATSSVFSYLSAHPEVCGSKVKETFFFSHHMSGRGDLDYARYMNYFALQENTRVTVEASPNYLGYKENVAPRIRSLLPDARLLFILRNPADRFYSYYNFAKGKLELPETLGFEEFFNLCAKYSASELSVKDAGIAEKHLRALEIGRYSVFLRKYYQLFPHEQVKVAFFDDLRRNPSQFMMDVARFLEIDPSFYQEYTFNKVNVTFSGRNRTVHRLGLVLNRMLESTLRQRPEIKRRLVQLYKRMNQDREGYGKMTEDMRARLNAFYLVSNRELADMLPNQQLPAWIRSSLQTESQTDREENRRLLGQNN